MSDDILERLRKLHANTGLRDVADAIVAIEQLRDERDVGAHLTAQFSDRAMALETSLAERDAVIARLREHLRVRHNCDFREPDLPDYFDVAAKPEQS